MGSSGLTRARGIRLGRPAGRRAGRTADGCALLGRAGRAGRQTADAFLE
jgi:hypothetical protein